jgi:hypothetical protein
MCDPTVLAIGSTVAGLAGSAANYLGEQQAAEQQKEEYDRWSQQQSENRKKAAIKDEEDRKMADAARTQGLTDVSAGSQKDAQSAEADRLNKYLSGQTDASNPTDAGAPTSVTDTRLSSGQSNSSDAFNTDLSTKLASADAAAKKRVAALATVGSYGGSFGGLDQHVSDAFQKSGEGIDLANDFRKGDMAVYGTQQNVDPLTYTYTKSPLADLSKQALNFGGQGLGKMLASRIG